MRRVEVAIIIGLYILGVLLALQGGFTITLEFICEYQDRDYLLLGLAFLLSAIVVSIAPTFGMNTTGQMSRSRILALPLAIVVIPALIGVVGAIITN